MSTREYRNLGKVEDGIRTVGMAIETASNLIDALGHALPDDTPVFDLAPLRKAYTELAEDLIL